MMFKYLLLILFVPTVVIAQNNRQKIRGVVSDKFSQAPLSGATIIINNLDFGAISDSTGRFEISNLAPNRYDITISFIGYKSNTISNIILTSGKEVIIEVQLEEDFSTSPTLIVQESDKAGTLSKLSSVSARTFSMEEVNRYAGGRNDPARLAANFAGVSAPDDSRNDIVIRGNSPVGVLWKIDGMNVSNPNHFASVGTTGGAVSALNTNLLKNSDFFTSAFPAEYGNATAGVFDINFRNGNSQRRETTLQTGVITGLEVTTEGPISSKNSSAYLIGYRYSLAGIAQSMGINIGTTATPTYQDLSFKINGKNGKHGKLSLFGILASSTIQIGEGPTESLYGNGNKINFSSKIGIAGLNHFMQLTSNSNITTTAGVNYSSTNQTSFEFDRIIDSSFIREVSNVQKTTYFISSNFNYKFNSRFFFKAGIQDELI